jgi:hypothetical protein
MSAARRDRKPWPMKWVALTIIIVLVPYTFLTLHYRKKGKAFEPHQDIKERANTLRLLSAGFQRVTLEATRPAERLSLSTTVPTQNTIGGLPSALGSSLIDKPQLPTEIVSVVAAPEANPLLAYPIEFACTLPDNKQQLGGAELYIRDGESCPRLRAAHRRIARPHPRERHPPECFPRRAQDRHVPRHGARRAHFESVDA